MTLIEHELAGAITAAYAASSIAYIFAFLTRREKVGRWGSFLLYAAVAAHSLWLVLERVQLGHLPMVSACNAISFVAWGIAMAYIVIELLIGQRVFGPFVTPVAFVFQAVSTGFLFAGPPPGPLAGILRSVWFEIHVGTALFSYCAFAIAFAAGLMHVLLFHELRLKHLGFFFDRMPPLEDLERVNRHAVALGFLFLTIGIGSGVIWSLRVPSGAVLLDAKEISAVIVWLLYAANVHTRSRLGWRGQRTAIFSVVNFVLLFAVFCVTSFVLKAHQF